MGRSRYYGSHTRSRYGSYTGTKSGGGVVFAMTVIVLAVLLYFGTQGQLGEWVRARIAPFAAMLGPEATPENTADTTGDNEDTQSVWVENEETPLPTAVGTALPSFTPLPTATNTVTEVVELPGVLLYAVQVGAFGQEANAKQAALEDREAGGAGFIQYSGGYYRVFREGYRLNNKAVTHKEQLEADGNEASIYPLEAPGIKLEITSGKERVEDVRAGYACWEAALDELEAMSDLSAVEARKRLTALSGNMSAMSERLESGLPPDGRNAIYQGLLDLYHEASGLFDRNLQIAETEPVDFVASIKYNYMELVTRYGEYIDRITQTPAGTPQPTATPVTDTE